MRLSATAFVIGFTLCSAAAVYPERVFLHAGRGGTLIDVTRPPFCAKGDGRSDDTAALCAAMRFVREHQRAPTNRAGNVVCNMAKTSAWTVYLPKGTYLVSDTVCQGWPALAISVRDGWDRVRYFEIASRAEEDRLAVGFKPCLHGEPSVAVLDTAHGDFRRGQYNNAPIYDEMNESIRLEGESREGTVIRLKDNAFGFGVGAGKPVVSFAMLLRGSNVNQGNFVRDLTIDVGRGNPGANALLWTSSNFGGIRSVTLRSGDRGDVGLDLSVNNACGYVRDLVIDGFKTGFRLQAGRESVLTVEESVVRNCALGFRLGGNDAGAGGDLLSLLDVRFADVGVRCERRRASMLDERVSESRFPRRAAFSPADVAVVEDFGAVGDGKTDDTAAVRRAMASGRGKVLFSRANYRLDGPVAVPASVREIDALHANVVRCRASDDAVFRCDEVADEPIALRRMYFAGGILFDHVAPRTVVVEDVYVEFHHVREQCFEDGYCLVKGCDPESGLWYAYRNRTPDVRKRVFAANVIQFGPGGDARSGDCVANVELDARMLNSEHFPGPNFSFRDSTARIFGIKCEDAPTMFALERSRLLAPVGSFLMFQKHGGPLVRAVDSSLDIGLYLWHWQFVPDFILNDSLSAAEIAANPERRAEIAAENACTVRLSKNVKKGN